MEKNEMKENKENVVIDDFDFSLIADFFKRVDRQGPGGEAAGFWSYCKPSSGSCDNSTS